MHHPFRNPSRVPYAVCTTVQCRFRWQLHSIALLLVHFHLLQLICNQDHAMLQHCLHNASQDASQHHPNRELTVPLHTPIEELTSPLDNHTRKLTVSVDTASEELTGPLHSSRQGLTGPRHIACTAYRQGAYRFPHSINNTWQGAYRSPLT